MFSRAYPLGYPGKIPGYNLLTGVLLDLFVLSSPLSSLLAVGIFVKARFWGISLMKK